MLAKKEVNINLSAPISWLLSKHKRIKILVGGRGSQKSTAVSDIMLMYVASGQRICCSREFQNSIDDSVHETLKQAIDRLGLDGFTVKRTEITHRSGGKVIYKGLARNIASLKSLSSVNRLWIEEGESVSQESLRVLTPSVRSPANKQADEEPPEIWVTMNWGRSTGAIADKYLKRSLSTLRATKRYEDDLVMIAVVNWRDNPWFPPELEQERQDAYRHLSRAEYDAIWEDAFSDAVPGSIILPEWFDAAIDAHKKLGFNPDGVKVVSHDPSDGKIDGKGLCYRHGSVVLDVQELNEGFIADGARWAIDYALNVNADVFIWDGDGMGVGIRDQVLTSMQAKHTKPLIFYGSHGVSLPDQLFDDDGNQFAKTRKRRDAMYNKRAEFYHDLRMRFYRTYQAVVNNVYVDPCKIISISSDIELIDKLRSEVCTIPRKQNGSGKFQVLDKRSMQKSPYNLPSPNLADSLMMSLDLQDIDLLDDNQPDIDFVTWG